MRTRIDMNLDGKIIPRDWKLEPNDDICAAFTHDRKHFVGYGTTRGEALNNANNLRLSILSQEADNV